MIRSLVFALMLGLAAGGARSAETRELTGVWVERGPRTTFRFEPCGPATCGILEDSIYIKADADARDVNNPDAGLRSRRLQGLPVLLGLRRAGPGWRGRVYIPSMGKTFPMRLDPVAARTLRFTLCLAPRDCHRRTLDRSD